MKRWVQFIIAMVISFLPGIFGMFFTPHGDGNMWYMMLAKTGLTPPGWVFSVAWTVLYFLIGWALYLIIKHAKKYSEKMRAYVLFAIQLLLNAIWPYVFFGLNMPGLALVILLVLFLDVTWMARAFFQLDRRTVYMLIPYLLWLMFAFYMNAYIVMMN